MDDKNITLQHLSIVLERISKHISNNFAPAVHVHGSNEITGMSGYTMVEEENQDLHLVLSSGDSLNKAIGKLERSVANIAYKIETEIANHLHDDIYYRKGYIDNKEAELLESDAQVLSDANTFTTLTVNAAVKDLVNGAPATLDTLAELAKALDEDENFAASVAANLSEKVAGPTYSNIDNIAVFNTTDGKTVRDSGYTINTSVPPNAIFTDYRVTSVPNTSKTLYLVGTSNAAGETGTLNFDSGIYVPSAGTLTANVFNGDLVGRADTAGVADEALKTRGVLTIQAQNVAVNTFNGSESKTINITRELLDVHDTSYTTKATDAEVQLLIESIFD